MKTHQILTGACNPGDRTFAVGSVEGIPFTAYASGCNIVILAKNFNRVQIIPGVCHDNIQIRCIDASIDSGKIAAVYEKTVIIFEPTPLVVSEEQKSSHDLDYWWVETARLDAEAAVSSMAWNGDGDRLLTAGDFLQLWRLQKNDVTDVKFEIDPESILQTNKEENIKHSSSWDCVWSTRPANPIVYLSFSPDGSLIATAGQHDRLVRIWYQNQPLLLPTCGQDALKAAALNDYNFSYIYLAHPQSVTGISWRKTSKYMPRGSVSNMLVTSCMDNICRIWSETILPEDGIVCMQQLDPAASQDSKFRTHRQKTKFIQRFRHMRQSFCARRMTKNALLVAGIPDPIASLPSTYSVHEFHNYGYQGTGVSPGGLHFHLSATINGVRDIPLVPSMGSASCGTVQNKQNFVLHWLNNKEMHFTQEAEKIMQELFKIAMEREDVIGVAENNDGGSKMSINKLNKTSSTASLSHVPSATSLSHSDVSQTGSAHSGLKFSVSPSEALDHSIETILNEWHQSSDLLYSIHPVDGSLLVWITDFLDEYTPGAFRQAQVSFSARIPCAIPLGDAMTMSSNVSMYNANTLILKNIFSEVLKTSEEEVKEKASEDDTERCSEKDEEIGEDEEEGDNEGKNDTEPEPKEHHKTKSKSIHRRYKPAPVVSMISKHTNGTLNLWNVMFAAKSKFSQLLNISHASRASGHRFRANGISCHPVLPLVLTTSHHNNVQICSSICQKENFCSELILWRVDPVGPLSRSGGISELARINSPEISAFTDVAWIPTLLPSNILGSVSNSPSAVFVGSDGHHLRIYLAVIDARALLAEMNSASRRNRMKKNEDLMSHSSDDGSTNPGVESLDNFSDNFNIVSTQSSSKPGCVIQLKSIDDASHNWANTLLLHAFQGKLVFSPSELHDKSYFFTSKMGAVVDLGQASTDSTAGFSEPFFVLLAEKMKDSSVIMHMWRLVISSDDQKKNSHGDHSSGSVTPDATQPFNEHIGDSCHACSVNVHTEKVCRQKLPLEEGTTVIYAVPAVGHLSSSSIYPACLAPYIMVTICSDNTIRFWRTRSSFDNESDEDNNAFVWEEWKMESDDGDSKIVIPGRPLSVCAAYSGRIAIAYQSGSSFIRPNSGNKENTRYVNLCVCIYECESTGGSGWILEDTISLKNIELKSVVPPLDLSIYDQTLQKVEETKEQISKQFDESKTLIKKGMTSVPSLSTYEGVRNYIDKMGNSASPLAPKQSVMLDWVSNENGAHILTIAVGNKVLLLTEVSSDISQANMKAMSETRTVASNRPLLRKSSSMSFQTHHEEIRWMQIRRVFLKTADGLNPTPMATSWVRDGLLLCGMDNEIAVYSQWRNDEGIFPSDDGKDFQDSRKIQDAQILNKVHESASRPILSVGSLSNLTSHSGKYAQADPEKRKKGAVSEELDMMPDLGLFEASRLVSPVLPQYHPKQLMELLNSGKIRWVKAILGHLVRCIGGPGTQGLSRTKSNSSSFGVEEKASVSPRAWSKSRTLSVLGTSTTSSAGGPTSPGEGFRSSVSGIPEELTLDYTEINSIPPLPLWTLLAADKETNIIGASNIDKKGESNGYDDLFTMKTDPNLEDPDTFNDELLAAEFGTEKRASKVIDRKGLSYFGPRQARIFSKLLTHAHLPGLSSLDQMHLLALADTVASCQLDLADKFAIDAAKKAVDQSLSSSPVVEGEVSLESLDDCGLRFLLAMKHFNYLKRCLPLNQRKVLQKQGLSSSNLVWGFHSESEEELINSIPCVAKGNPNWPELRELGLAWWLRNNSSLKKLMEKVAKSSFKANNDPLDAAIFYLAMKKKNLVWGLYRSIKDPKMTAFFSNNFSEDRWRKAALKNAFSLLGKQRFLHAAAFFLLSGSIKDAIDICIDKLDDLQLAMVIARLYAGELNQVPDILKELVNKQLLGSEGGDEEDNVTAHSHPDPFLRSMAHWMNRNYSASLSSLLLTNVGFLHPKYTDEQAEKSIKRRKVDADPSVFNFYVYLRTHPLILREQISKNQDSSKAIMLSGFKGDSSEGEGATFKEDGVTPLERRLYFSTAHFHLRAGCPVLALEVLNKLPNKIISSKLHDKNNLNSYTDESNVENSLVTGIFHQTQMDLSQPKPTSKKDSDEMDWSQPIERPSDDIGLDWSKPITSSNTEDDDELKLEWSDDPDTDDDYETNSKNNSLLKEMAHKSIDESLAEKNIDERGSSFMSSQGGILDIMAQQLKFIACLKIMMEELGTLATGFEVDGGLLRYQLYIWLEREVEALKVLCSYGLQDELNHHINLSAQSDDSEGISNFEDVDPLDFESKIVRAMKRKTWLIENQTLLRTLLSYCGLHGCNGGGLSSVRMELILLLQELQQEKTQKQLLSPLPFPTTLPLLSACIAQQKTVVSDPVKHLEALTHDMLYTMMQEKIPPFPGHANYDELFVLRDLSVALSSCVYQSLCDSDSLHFKKLPSSSTGGGAVLDALSRLSVVYQDSSLISTTCSRKLSLDTGTQIEVTTEPSKWPGVTSLRALLDRDKDEDTPHLNVLLCETFVAIYLSLLCYALATCDAHILFRLISQHITPAYWAHLFGGGYKKSIKAELTSSTQSKEIPTICSEDNIETLSTSVASKDIVGLVNTVNTVTSQVTSSVNSLTKQRVKLNMKLLGVQIKSSSGSNQQCNDGTGGTPLGSKPVTRENFKSPDMSIIGKLMSKPPPNEVEGEFYDSGAESESEDEDDFDELDDPFSNAPPKEENVEHLDPESFSWTLIRFAVIRLSQNILEKFLTLAGIEIPVSLLRHNSSDAVQDSYEDLPVASPLIYGCLRATDTWLDAINCKLHSFENKSEQLFPGCYADSSVYGPAIEKYKCLFEPQNTPFRNKGQGLGPVKRLWSFLIRQQTVQHVFIKHIFGKRKVVGDSPTLSSRVIDTNPSSLRCATSSTYSSGGDASESFQHQILKMNKPVKVIHKEQDGITAFCINKKKGEENVSSGLMTLATHKELQELDISLLLNPTSWQEGMNEEADFDVLCLSENPESLPASNFLAIQTPGDPLQGSHGVMGSSGGGSSSSVSSQINSPSGPQPPPFGPSGNASNVGQKGSSVVKKHRMDGVRRLASHTHLPLYVTGCHDGSISMWEWSHNHPVATVRPSGVFAKVNRVLFTSQGNKFGACDGDGNVSIWQAANSSNPYFTFKCHSKGTSDFVFQGDCSSLFCTSGHSSDGRNVAIWDTLMPQKRCNVASFLFHDNGASSIAYVSSKQQLVTTGKRGEVAVWDLRQRKQIHFFKGHDHSIKCLTLDPNEDFFVTGSLDGDIKIWSLNSYKCFYTFVQEHARHGLFKNISQGVSQVYLDSYNRLYSCGADGSIKVRQLPDRDLIVSSI